MNSRRISKTKSIETDIVVIGGGGCGMAAAVAAAEKGAKVILLEKKGAPGGNSVYAHGIFAAESPAQRRLSIDISKDEMFTIYMEHAHWKVNPRIFRALVDKSGDTIRWLEDKGLEFDNIPPMYVGYHLRTWHGISNKIAGIEILKTLRKKGEELGVEFYFNCDAKKILTDEKGNVSGLMAETKGQELRINAKTVIIATGGYGGNKELLKKYRPSYTEDIIYLGLPHIVGDGLQMAIEIGAATEGLGFLHLYAYWFPGAGNVNGIAQEPYTLGVNKSGERFADEALTLRPSECGNAVDRQPDKCVYALFDEKLKNRLMEEGFLRGGLGWMSGVKVPNLNNELKAEADKGGVKIADSWDDIAGWIGADPEVLKSTVEEYNLFCDRGHDALFAKDRRYLQALRTPPFYAVKCYLCFLTTTGGIKINHHMEVLNEQGKQIPGLYAGGDATGGWESDTYCLIASGHEFGFAVNSGRIAGENATKEALGE